ncbi:MAG: prohibitin family protein [Bacteroidetes bacterium]|nr:prohibitin family protein [Bacteroidota bacterium]MDA0903248.1 prohibitin family protein [Bacteroidota bacterium]MDA1242193.1 prohibitin family protein [Bacteroidota bacterium]
MNPSSEDRRRLRSILFALIVILPVFMLWGSLTVTIPSGYAGLTFHTFGQGVDPQEQPLSSGFHFKAPWNKVYEYEVRQTEQMEALEVLSSNLLKINMDMTVFTQPMYDKLGYLETERGRNYEEKVIRPAMRSVAREVIAKYLPEEFNTTKREMIQLEIKNRLSEKLTDNYIQLNDVLIRNIQLPKTLEQAIERKLQQEQESLEYEFRLEKAQKEADRLRIEAEGIRDFEEIVSKGLSDKLLKWKGIEATKEIAKSPNTKVVIVGGGDDGLPLILGDH